MNRRQGFGMNTSGIGKRIINLREAKNWSQRELAKRVRLNPSVMNRIELEDRPIKDFELDLFASVLHTSTDYLLGRELNEKYEGYNTTKNIQELLHAIGIEDVTAADLNHLNQEDIDEIKKHLAYIMYRAKERHKV